MGKATLGCWILALTGLGHLAAAADSPTVRVAVAKLEIRSAPSPQAKVVATALRDDYLEVAEDAGEGWLLVRVPALRKLGFVESRHVVRVGDRRQAATAASSQVATPAAPAPRPATRGRRPEVTALLSLAYAPTKVSLSESSRFTMYQEDSGRLDIDYDYKTGLGLDAGLRVLPKPWVGLQLSYTAITRDGSYALNAVLPHPLVPNRDRTLSLSADGLSWSEKAFHLDVVFARRTDKLRLAAFAGPTFFSVKADLIEKLVFEHKYPFDTQDITSKSASASELTDSPVGFNVGVTVDVALHRRVGVGALIRYSRATAELARPAPSDTGSPASALGPQEVVPPADPPVKIDLGGLQLGVGVRFYF
jgi:hypothetical protein